ncbi:cytochrome ubiquinol oxidase subunit I [Campylobacter jejuni]
MPLTLGLSFMIAIMETIYVKTKNERWKNYQILAFIICYKFCYRCSYRYYNGI